MKVLGISGTIIGAKPVSIVEKILEEIKKKTDWAVELLDLSNYDMEFCDGRKDSDYNQDTQTVIQKITDADAYIISTPIFNGSFPAPLKNVIDLVQPKIFEEKIMGFAAAGGNPNHYLVIENQLKPIAGYLRAYVAPTYVFTLRDSFDENNNVVSSEALKSIDQMTNEVIILSAAVDQTKEKVFKI